MLKRTNNFDEIRGIVNTIKSTENTWTCESPFKLGNLCNVDSYSPYGLAAAGTRVNFPARWIMEKLNPVEPMLATEVIRTRYKDYFANNNNKGLLIRDFGGKHWGVLTDRYSIFDDDEVVNIISENEYLMGAKEFWYDITPERCHMRFISGKQLYVDGDDSPLSMCVFVDNSMVGASSFKIRFGIYRWACTNGIIAGLKEFEIVREIHTGEKEYAKIVAKALENVEQYENMLLDMVKEATITKSSIYDLTEEDALSRIKDKLNVSKKDSAKIIDFYRGYGGKTKWDLINAITDFAHEYDISKRVELESKALKVA